MTTRLYEQYQAIWLERLVCTGIARDVGLIVISYFIAHERDYAMRVFSGRGGWTCPRYWWPETRGIGCCIYWYVDLNNGWSDSYVPLLSLWTTYNGKRERYVLMFKRLACPRSVTFDALWPMIRDNINLCAGNLDISYAECLIAANVIAAEIWTEICKNASRQTYERA